MLNYLEVEKEEILENIWRNQTGQKIQRNPVNICPGK